MRWSRPPQAPQLRSSLVSEARPMGAHIGASSDKPLVIVAIILHRAGSRRARHQESAANRGRHRNVWTLDAVPQNLIESLLIDSIVVTEVHLGRDGRAV